jgi:uncharacterized protein (DUF1501 family)
MKRTLDTSRREFLQAAGRMSVLGAAAPLALNLAAAGAAAAQTASDYKALVCVFLYGANDHNNTIIPLDAANHAAYRAARASIARPLADLNDSAGNPLELAPRVALTGNNAGRRFALPKELAPLKPLWDGARLAVLANVGPLIVPCTKAQLDNRTVPLPRQLFSHNDQQSTWQAGAVEGAPSGWGGRIGDLFAAQNGNAIFTCTSVAGDAVWTSGNVTKGYQVSPNGSVKINALPGAFAASLFGSPSASAALASLIGDGGSHPLTQDLASVTRRSIEADASLSAALASAPLLNVPAEQSGNSLALQLRMVARAIAARTTLGARRQVFFVALGGFDTHDNQLTDQPALHAKLAGALAYFDGALEQIGAAQQVTTFTASDFGRTLTSNGDGSDHGWGSHHLIMGGAVSGQRFYGTFPVMGLNNADEVGSGRLLPSTSVDQYAATLARWFGVGSDSDLRLVLPNIGNFDAADLGFMG